VKSCPRQVHTHHVSLPMFLHPGAQKDINDGFDLFLVVVATYLYHGTIIEDMLDQILAPKEAYVDLWCSCQIGDAYIDLSIHLFDTYTEVKCWAPPLNPNPTLRDDRTQNPPNRICYWCTCAGDMLQV
jgi:hypothetical protein